MNMFYNRAERRLRAPWRLLIQLALLTPGIKLVSILSAIPVLLVALLFGLLPLGGTNDLQSFIAAFNQMLFQQPALVALHRLISIFVVILFFALIARFLDRRSWRAYGFRLRPGWWGGLGFGMLLGALAMAAVFGIEKALGWVTVTGTTWTSSADLPFWPWLVNLLAYYGTVAVNEELLSRGSQLRNLAEGLNLPRIGPRNALLISYVVTSSAFALLHIGNPNITAVAITNLILAGLMLGLGRVLTGDLAIPLGLHLTWNFFQGSIFGFPVSGGAPAVALIRVQQSGPDFWTGGAFGPEGGMLCVLVMLAVMALTWAYVRLAYGRAALDTRLAVYTGGRIPEGPGSAVEQEIAAGTPA